MEEERCSEETVFATAVESPLSRDLCEDKVINLHNTIHVENSALKVTSVDSMENVNPTDTAENRRKRVKEEKPLSKIIVRRLPPTMSKEMFLEQVSPLPEVDYMYYIQGDTNNAINPFSRAYLNFIVQEDLFSFSRTFDNYVFLDAKGQEYPAVVEFAMFQRVPKQRSKKKDPLMGTIETDPTYITFKENLLAEALENSKTGGKAVKQHYFETEISTAEEVNTTPLLEFLKVRRAEKARMREERREEKKKKDLERKLKQKTKDRKGEGEEEETLKEAKMQCKLSDSSQDNKLVERNKQVGENEKKTKRDEPCYKSVFFDMKKDNFEEPITLHDQKISIMVKPLREIYENKTEAQKKGNSSSNDGAVDSYDDKSTFGDTNSVPDAEVKKIKEAEQQTIYLRKLLGLPPSGSQQPVGKNEVSGISNDKNSNIAGVTSLVGSICLPILPKRAADHLEEVLSAIKSNIFADQKTNIFWSKNNVNPALPSASFKKSSWPAENYFTLDQRSWSASRCLGESKNHFDFTRSEFRRNLIKGALSTPNVSLNVPDSQRL